MHVLDEILARGIPTALPFACLYAAASSHKQSKATSRFETLPGSRFRRDGSFKRLYAYVMVLGYSRTMYV
jgi:hypothetical protein